MGKCHLNVSPVIIHSPSKNISVTSIIPYVHSLTFPSPMPNTDSFPNGQETKHGNFCLLIVASRNNWHLFCFRLVLLSGMVLLLSLANCWNNWITERYHFCLVFSISSFYNHIISRVKTLTLLNFVVIEVSLSFMVLSKLWLSSSLALYNLLPTFPDCCAQDKKKILYFHLFPINCKFAKCQTSCPVQQ